MTTIKRFTPDYKMHAVRFEAFAREAEHGELVQFDDHQQAVSDLEAERDAARNAIAAIYKAVTGECPEWSNWHAYLDDIVEEVGAKLAALQAQGVEKFADDLHKTAMAMCSVKPDNTTPGAYAVLARSFAKKLREAK
ncbi:hypothetical protein CLM65_14160 [Serratia marcescens]|uniref:hypothetical protein n=1 Tax=Serratia marcescens TaxID=615 RepID=UPI0004470841|nr:hypothetical protein [Serratia marcescens]AWC76418.1 hypothetical protein AM371_16455 [Serratia marcescens]EZQ73135.1 hypothetical protein AF53_00382 [Serratia marcescens BIDMC 80]MCK1092082.1 hypothetical protein [Serratia marcescens]RLO30368.1 hypothetical protein CLM65_14160 [Serratia marcescens]RZF15001.1 hypothetical protein B7L32_12765 [Serratia marcescens]